MAILNKGHDFSDGEQVTSTKLDAAIDSAVFTSQAVDNVSTQLSGGAIIVKDGGIATAKIADGNVTLQKLATTLKDSLYPIGSIYTNATNATNPSTLIGFGTWVAFGAGKVPVGIDSGDTDFDTAEETGGSKTHTLTISEMPSHDHNAKAYGNGQGSVGSGYLGVADTTSINGQGRQSIDHEGGGQAHNNLQPYIVVYMWKRTA